MGGDKQDGIEDETGADKTGAADIGAAAEVPQDDAAIDLPLEENDFNSQPG